MGPIFLIKTRLLGLQKAKTRGGGGAVTVWRETETSLRERKWMSLCKKIDSKIT